MRPRDERGRLTDAATLPERVLPGSVPGEPGHPPLAGRWIEALHAHTLERRVRPMLSRREISRRSFMRRMLGAGVGVLSLEFVGGTLAFLWPNITEGLGATFRVGKMGDILLAEPRFAQGYPYDYAAARSFLINIPAARALATGEEVSVPAPAAGEMVALWRKCPHLGCIVPELCESVKRFECRCHGSTYNILGEKLEKGPAERGMDRFAVLVEEDGTVVIDTREIIRGAPEGALTFTDPHPHDAGCA